MKTEHIAWNVFLETGKIDDYLMYCKQRKQQMLTNQSTGGTTPTDVTLNYRNRPTGL